ncbi:MAG: hypothetical protein IMY67_06965 [Bacteroidetes bacterium]|nr:hypothetical protein [Bacteroidota bacterium]
MDKYSLNARVYPIIIVLLPVVIIGIAYSFEYEKIQQTLSALGITAALTYFLSNIGRDQGKKKEGELWASWGGAPTSQLFSFRNKTIDLLTKERYHSKMTQLSEIEHDVDFKTATLNELNDTYSSWTKILISKTRDIKTYPLIFKELTSYGFRRNLWGLRLIGITITVAFVIINIAFQIFNHSFSYLDYSVSFYISELFLLIFLSTWIFIINSEWVKIPAFGYGERLLEAIDQLHAEWEK